MASIIGDKILWTTILLSGTAACWFIPHVLGQFKEASTVTVPKSERDQPRLKQDAEDAIEPSTLAEIASGPSYNLAAAAIRLAVSKFLKSDAKQILLKDLASKDHDRRDKAINAFRLLLTNTALKETTVRSYFTDEVTYQALVTALVNLLPEHKKTSKPIFPPPSPIRPVHRPAHEATILSFIWILVYEPRQPGSPSTHHYFEDAQSVIDAGIITRWLKFYPFPCTLPEYRRWNFKRRDVCRLLQEDVWGTDDEPMSLLMAILMRNPTGMRQLADIGLTPTPMQESINIQSAPRVSLASAVEAFGDDGQEVTLYDDEVEEGDLIDNDEMMSRLQETPRLRSGRTAGERSLRRRHRQAVVVADAGMPLREENILQRLPTETELNWENEISGRQDELLRDTRNRAAARSGNRDGSGRQGRIATTGGSGVGQIAMERIDGIDEGAAGGIWRGPVPPDIDLGALEWSSTDEENLDSGTDSNLDSDSDSDGADVQSEASLD